jgi:hypothetical protein
MHRIGNGASVDATAEATLETTGTGALGAGERGVLLVDVSTADYERMLR